VINRPEMLFARAFSTPQRRHLGMFVHGVHRYSQQYSIHLQSIN